jgi:NNP family nitrate/nitrite transporter-like MFS transporter
MDRNPSAERAAFGRQMRPVMLVVLIVFLNLFSRSLFSPLLLEIEEEFSIRHAAASRFFLIISIGYGVSLLFSGYISALIRHKGAIILSISIIGGAQLLVSLAPTLFVVHIGLVLLGLGAGFYPPSGVSALTAAVSSEHWNKALSLHEAGPNLGLIAAPLFVAAFGGLLGWRGVFLLTGIVCIAVGLLYMKLLRVGRFFGEPPRFSTIAPLLRTGAFWILLTLFILCIGAVQGVYSLMPTFLVTEAGMAKSYANTLVGISRILPVGGVLSAGFIADRIGSRRFIFLLLALEGALILALSLLHGPLLNAAVLLQPVFAAMYFPVGLSILSSIGSESSRNIVLSSVFVLTAVTGTGVIPAFLGYMGEHFTFAAGFTILGGALFITSPLAVKLPAASR